MFLDAIRVLHQFEFRVRQAMVLPSQIGRARPVTEGRSSSGAVHGG